MDSGHRTTIRADDIIADQRTSLSEPFQNICVFLFGIQDIQGGVEALCVPCKALNIAARYNSALEQHSTWTQSHLHMWSSSPVEEVLTCHLDMNTEISVVIMYNWFRRLAIFHRCTSNCQLSTSCEVIHSSTLTLIQKRFYIKGRRNGSPLFQM